MSTLRALASTLCGTTLILACALNARASLVGNKSDWKIALPPSPHPTEEHAADELRTTIQRMSGISLPVLRGSGSQNTHLVILGTPESSVTVKEKAGDLGLSGASAQTVAVYTMDDSLYLAGNSPRAVLYAVYTFLQDVMQVQWLWPGPDGEFIPKYASFELPDLAINKTPGFEYRGFHLCYQHVNDAFETWMTRNFVNLMRSEPSHGSVLSERRRKGLHIMFSSHNVILPIDAFRENPEYFALIDGQRRHEQLCYSNPAVERIIAQMIKEWVQANPEVEIISLMAADNPFYCQCPECATVSSGTGWFGFIRKVCVAVKSDHPRLEFSSLAYLGSKELPETDLSWMAFVEYCQQDHCYVHKYGAKCELNDRSLESIAAWQTTGVPVGVYGYQFDIIRMHSGETLCLPIYSRIADEVRKFRELDLPLVIPEVPVRNAEGDRDASKQNRLGLYIYAQLMWDPDQSLDTLLRRWNRLAFGQLADDMRVVQDESMDMWDNADAHITDKQLAPESVVRKVLTQEKMARISELLAAARAKLPTIDDEEERQRAARNLAWEETLAEQWIEAYYTRMAPLQNTVNLPKARDDAGAFAVTAPVSGITRTEIGMSWRDAGLNLTALCKELPGAGRQPGDSVELRIKCIHDYQGRYRQVTINPDGTHRSVVVPISTESVPTWTPELSVRTRVHPDNWTVELSIPFSSAFPRPENGEMWLFSVRRSLATPGGVDSYPAAAGRELDSFANLYFTGRSEVNKRFLLCLTSQAQIDRASNLMQELTRENWDYTITIDPQILMEDLSSYDVVCFCEPGGGPLDQEQVGEVTRELLRSGKVVIFSGYSDLAVDRYLGDPSCRIAASGWRHESKLDYIAEGTWRSAPDDLLRQLKRCAPPIWGYTPDQPEKWTVLFTIRAPDGTMIPGLMVRPYEKGLLVVGGGNMGTGAGYELFGELRHYTVRMLLNNLLEYSRGLQ